MAEIKNRADAEGDADLGEIVLDADLEALSISTFDDLVSKGEIIYEPSDGQVIQDSGFHFEFRLVPHIKKKPITASDAPERKTGQGFNPFLNPDPNFVISPVGESHTLLLNKFCVCRPSLLLSTRLFAPQSNALDIADLTAAWAVLDRLGSLYYAIYNCGFEAGSSQGHKHMQIWPYPSKEDLTFELFPSQATSTTDISSDIPKVPFEHFALRLPGAATSKDVAASHGRLLEKMRESQAKAGSGPDHNVILTRDWICLVPRHRNGGDKGAPANASTVVGLVWVATEEEKQVWQTTGPLNHLRYLCISK